MIPTKQILGENLMILFQYDAKILPKITLAGGSSLRATSLAKNVSRVTDEYVLYLITDGEMFVTEGDRDYHLKKGDCFLFEPGIFHYGTKESYFNIIFIHFKHPDVIRTEKEDGEWERELARENLQWLKCMQNDQYPSEKITIAKHFHLTDELVFANLCTMAKRVAMERDKHLANFNVLCACAADSFFVELYRSCMQQKLQKDDRSSSNLQRIHEVLHYLNENYSRKITGDQIEQELSYNFDYLNQLFQKHLHTTVFKMLETIRMEKAKELLYIGRFTIKEIAREVGFSDESYFFRVFKKNTGLSPASYRKNQT